MWYTGIQPGFSPILEAATTTLSNGYQCCTAPGTEPRIAFLVRNAVVPHVLETIYSPNRLAAVQEPDLPNGLRCTIAGVYSRFSRHDKQEVDLFLESMKPYNILMGDYNDDIWSPNPTRTTGEFLDPLHANSQPPEPRWYSTHIPRRGRPQRLNAILVRQQIPNIPWTYYDTMEMPILDHALVMSVSGYWRIGVPDTPHRKPQPSVSKWYALPFQRFTNTMSTVPAKTTDAPLHRARGVFSAIAHAARPRLYKHGQPPTTRTWTDAPDPTARLWELGEAQEQQIRKQIGKLRRALVHRSGYLSKMVKQWQTGLIAQDMSQPLIGGTHHVSNHFARDPSYNEDSCQRLLRKHVRHGTWNTLVPTYDEYMKCLHAPKNKWAGRDGVPPHLLRHFSDHMLKQRYQAILDFWKGHCIPTAWLRRGVMLIYKQKDPQDPRNYRPIYISTAINNILTRLIPMRIANAMTPSLLSIQHGALQGTNTTTLATKLLNDLHAHDGYIAMLDVAKAFPLVPRLMLTNIVKEAGAPDTIIRMPGEIYQHTLAVLSLHGGALTIPPTQGIQDGCPLSRTIFLLYYDIFLRETMWRCPEACLYVFVANIAVPTPATEALLQTLDTLHEVVHTMGLRFNKEKTEVYRWAKNYNLEPITWQHQELPVRPPILTYLGHVLAHPTPKETAWDMVTTQLNHDIAAYKTLPLNGYKKVTVINDVLIPQCTYRALFPGNRSRMALWDDIVLHYPRDTTGIEQQMNKYRLSTDRCHGGLGPPQVWWSYIIRWITLGQQMLQNNGLT